MKTSSIIPDEEGKIRYINEHFRYEVEELLYSALFFISVQARAKQLSDKKILTVFQNTVLDHTLLHARNLLEFYYYKDKEGYARARAYVSSWQFPIKTPNVRKLEARVNDEVTHLGWKRLDVKDKTWNPLDVINELLGTTADFLVQLDRKFYREGLTMLETEMKELRVKRHTDEGGQVLEYYDLFDAAMKSVSLNGAEVADSAENAADSEMVQKARIAVLEHFTSQMQQYKYYMLTLVLGFAGILDFWARAGEFPYRDWIVYVAVGIVFSLIFYSLARFVWYGKLVGAASFVSWTTGLKQETVVGHLMDLTHKGAQRRADPSPLRRLFYLGRDERRLVGACIILFFGVLECCLILRGVDPTVECVAGSAVVVMLLIFLVSWPKEGAKGNASAQA
jgi:hypothetical protein